MIEPKESIPYGRYGKFLRTKMLVRFFSTFCLKQIVKKTILKRNLKRFPGNPGFFNFPLIIPHSYRRKEDPVGHTAPIQHRQDPYS